MDDVNGRTVTVTHDIFGNVDEGGLLPDGVSATFEGSGSLSMPGTSSSSSSSSSSFSSSWSSDGFGTGSANGFDDFLNFGE